MQSSKQLQIDIIRHGQPQGGEVIRGRTDQPLTALGWRQFNARIERHFCAWDYILSSPLQRCLAAAEKLSTTHHIPLQVDARLRELDFGDWENKPVSDLMSDQQAQRLWKNPMHFTPPNGEPVADMRLRLRQLWQTLEQYEANSKLLLVCHGGVMRVLMHDLFRLHDEAVSQLNIPFAGFIRLQLHLQAPQSWAHLDLFDGQELVLL